MPSTKKEWQCKCNSTDRVDQFLCPDLNDDVMEFDAKYPVWGKKGSDSVFLTWNADNACLTPAMPNPPMALWKTAKAPHVSTIETITAFSSTPSIKCGNNSSRIWHRISGLQIRLTLCSKMIRSSMRMSWELLEYGAWVGFESNRYWMIFMLM